MESKKYRTRKNTPHGKAQTIARRKARRAKYQGGNK